MKLSFTILLTGSFTASLLFTACNSSNSAKPAAKKSTDFLGVDLKSMNPNVVPCDNFYEFANGEWLKNNPIPETEARWSSFNEVRDRNMNILKGILEAAASTENEPNTNQQKIGDFYAAAMDTVNLEKAGFSPLKRELAMIDAIKTKDDLVKVLVHQHQNIVNSLFDMGVEQDFKQNDQYAVLIGQGGLGLPDRDYYLKDGERFENIRDEYVNHIEKIFLLIEMNEENAIKYASEIVKLETELATASMTRVELRDIESQYNKMTVAELKQLSPEFNWELYWSELGVSIETVIVNQPEFFKKVNEVLANTSMDIWKNYLKWHLLKRTAAKLSSDFEQQHFNFYGTILSGTKKMQPRWKRVQGVINTSLDHPVGMEYVKVAFSEENKKRVNEMVDNLFAVYRDRIKNLDWMSEATKEQALIKLNAISRKLGYPDKWKDYSTLEIKRDSYVQNFLRANRFHFDDNINKLGKPIDKTEWGMPPQIVNAYYNPLMNEIVFPAGIMQPPFFNPEADDAVNYGSMGAVIGHELTHGFDDMGNKFDAAGNLKEWWTEEDRENFNKKAQIIVEQFNGFEALDSLYVNGKLTLGENIADLGGVSIAYEAYQRSLEGKERKDIDGFTPEQRFFISYGQVWKGNYRDQALRQLIYTNPHAPGNFRVLGPLSNIPEFYDAFTCSENAEMKKAAAENAKIW